MPAAPLWRIPSFWIALALGAGLAVSAQQAWQRLIRPAFGERPGIAVLPFANLSPDPENAYFADGLHEEILATLARAGGLRVISRTSVQEYRDTKRSVREIADALDVSLILEGSVRRAGDDLRLTLQLIDGRTDEHLWAETYDRKFDNALHLQRAVAQQVVAAIGTRLTPTEEQLVERSAPTVPEAYGYYLQALARWNQADEQELRAVEGLLSRTLELDPGFALGYALRAKVRVWIGITTEGPHVFAAVGAAKLDIERALQLQPDLPEALAARAMYTTYVEHDAAGALPDLNRALELAPSDADTHSIAGLTTRRLGRFDEAIGHFREAARLKPGDNKYVWRALETLDGLGRFEETERELEDLERRYPDPYWELVRFRQRFHRFGVTDGWRDAYERIAPKLSPQYRPHLARTYLLATGDLEGWIAYVELLGPEGDLVDFDRDEELGIAYWATGIEARARPHLLTIVEKMERSPKGTPMPWGGAVALELLGRHAEAIRAADEAVRLMPESRDAVNGPTVAIQRAWVLIHGRGARAEDGYAEFERLLGAYMLQPRVVAAEPLWLILRDDARVQQIFRDVIAKVAEAPDARI